MDSQYDLLIIGGGPAGLSAAINGMVHGCSVFLLDAGASKLALAEKIDNYPGLPGISGGELIAAMAGHARKLGVAIEKGRAISALPIGNQFMVSYSNQLVTGKALILATGAHREKTVEGEDAYLGKGVSYCATCDGMLFRGGKAVVYGLTADAPEEAHYLEHIGVHVVYVNPGERPKGLKEEIEWRRGRLSAIRGGGSVEAVELDDPPQPPIETQAVFLLRDAVAPQSMVAGLMMENGYVSVDSSGKTGIPGLFACGDCTGPPLQIAKATGDGLVAGQEAAKYIYELS